MAERLGNEFLIAVKVTELQQVKALYDALQAFHALAAKPLPEVVLKTRTVEESLKKTSQAAKQTTQSIKETSEALKTGLSTDTTGTTKGVKGLASDLDKVTQKAREAGRELDRLNQKVARPQNKITGQFVSDADIKRLTNRTYKDPVSGRFRSSNAVPFSVNQSSMDLKRLAASAGQVNPYGSKSNPFAGISSRDFKAPIERSKALDAFSKATGFSSSDRKSTLDFTTGLENASRRTARAQKELSETTKQADNAFGGFLSKLKSLSYYAAAGSVVFGLVIGIRSTISELVKFEGELARIQGFFDDKSLTNRLTIERGAIQAARDYGIALGEVVRVAKFFAQAGFSPTEVVRQTRASLGASAALGIAPEEAAQTAIAVREISGGRTSSQDIFERIATIDARNAVNAADLNAAIQRVGSFVSQLQPRAKGIVDAFDLVIGSTTQIVETTRVSGNQAANALKFVVARLSAPETANALQSRFGLRLASNQEGTQFRPLVEILQDIAETYKTLKGSGRNIEATQLLAQVGGSRQIGLVTALFDNFGKAMDVATQSSKAYGELQGRLNIQLDTVEKRFSQFGTSFLGFVNRLFEQTGALSLTKGALQAGSNFFGGAAQDTGGALGALVGSAVIGGLGIRGIKGLGRTISLAQAGERGPGNLFKRFIGSDAAGIAGGSLITKLRGVGAPGMTVFARITAAIGAIFSSLSPFGIIVGLTALGALVTWIMKNREKISTVPRTTQSQIDQSDFGKDLAALTGPLGITNSELVSRLRIAKDSATAQLISRGRVESFLPAGERNEAIAQFADPDYTRRAVNFEVRNRQFRPLMEEFLTRAFLEPLDQAAVEALTGNRLTASEKVTDAQVSFVQNLLRQGINYENAPNVADQTALRKLQNDLLGQINPDDVVKTLGSTRPYSISRSGLSADISGQKTLEGVLKSSFGRLAPNFQVLSDVSIRFGDRLNALSEITEAAKDNTKSWAQILDDFFTKKFTTEGGLAPEVVAANKAALAASYEQLLPQITGLSGPEFTTAKSTPGVKTAQIIIEAIQKAIQNSFEKGVSRTSATGQALSKYADALGQLGPEFLAKINKTANVIATARDRVADALTDFAQKMAEITGAAPALRQAGLNIDVYQEQLGVVQNAIRAFAAIPAQFEKDLISTGLKISQLEPYLAKQLTIPEILKKRDEGEIDDIDPDTVTALRSGRGANELEKLREIYGLANGLLDVFKNNQAVLSYADPKNLESINKAFQIDGEGPKLLPGARPSDIIQAFIEVSQLLQQQLVAQRAITRNIEQQAEAQRLQLDYQYDLTQISSDSARAANVRRGGFGIAQSLADIERQRQRSNLQANLEFDKQTQLIANKLGVQDFERDSEFAGAENSRDLANQRADQDARLAANRLLADRIEQIMDTTADRIQGVIDNAFSGFRDTFKNTALLFGQGGFQFRDTAAAIVPPIAQSIQDNIVDNFFDTLTDRDGIFSKELQAIFGQSEKDRQRADLLKLHTEATHIGTLKALEDFNSGITSDSAQAGTTGTIADLVGANGPQAKKIKIEQLKKDAARLAGIYGGTLLGGAAFGKGVNSYAGEGATIGQALGGLIPGAGPLGAIGGGLVGGLLGGIFGKPEPPKPPREPAILERIERNTRASATALENQNRNLFSLDSRFLNAPSGFTLPSYRPAEAGSAGSSSQVITFNITSNNPQAVANAVEKVVTRQKTTRGTYTPLRVGS